MRHGIFVLALIGTTPAAAQSAPEQDSTPSPDAASLPEPEAEPRRDPQTQVFQGDYVIVGVGLGSFNTYDGSDDRRLMPVAGAMGRVGGRNFRIRGPNVSVDLIRHTPDQHLRFRLGPTLRYGGNRTGNIGDPVVKQLGKLESGFDSANGQRAQSGRLFGRQATIGLANDAWGSLEFGRQATIGSNYLADIDPFYTSYTQSNMGLGFSAANTMRWDNMVMYKSPSMSGFEFGVGYSFNADDTVADQTGFRTADNTRGITAGLRYVQGPVNVTLLESPGILVTVKPTSI